MLFLPGAELMYKWLLKTTQLLAESDWFKSSASPSRDCVSIGNGSGDAWHGTIRRSDLAQIRQDQDAIAAILKEYVAEEPRAESFDSKLASTNARVFT